MSRKLRPEKLRPSGCLENSDPKDKTNLDSECQGISERTVGLLAEIVVITRNIMGEQVYDRNNRVTTEIRNHEGHDCSTKPQIHDNKDGSYRISYHLLKKPEHAKHP